MSNGNHAVGKQGDWGVAFEKTKSTFNEEIEIVVATS